MNRIPRSHCFDLKDQTTETRDMSNPLPGNRAHKVLQVPLTRDVNQGANFRSRESNVFISSDKSPAPVCQLCPTRPRCIISLSAVIYFNFSVCVTKYKVWKATRLHIFQNARDGFHHYHLSPFQSYCTHWITPLIWIIPFWSLLFCLIQCAEVNLSGWTLMYFMITFLL